MGFLLIPKLSGSNSSCFINNQLVFSAAFKLPSTSRVDRRCSSFASRRFLQASNSATLRCDDGNADTRAADLFAFSPRLANRVFTWSDVIVSSSRVTMAASMSILSITCHHCCDQWIDLGFSRMAPCKSCRCSSRRPPELANGNTWTLLHGSQDMLSSWQHRRHRSALLATYFEVLKEGSYLWRLLPMRYLYVNMQVSEEETLITAR